MSSDDKTFKFADISSALSELTAEEEEQTKKTTGLIYDDRMVEHCCLWDPNYIERPERYLCPLQRCKEYGLVRRCLIIPSKFADENEILLLHSKEYLEIVKKTKSYTNIADLEALSSTFDSVFFHPKTYELALLAVGCTLQLISSVLDGSVRNGMAIVRPPGHHAMEKEACGFCFFNNVALATKYALLHYNLKRILIVDWDVHHGQATQQMFYDDPRVLYFSIHRYEHGAFWPELRESNFDFVGESSGKGYNINVPLNETKMGNSEYLAIFNNVLLPVAYEFCPELIIVSAGYDAALGCVEGEMEVTPQAYSHLLHMLLGLADGHVCVVLEGGYCLSSLSESVALSLRTLLGDPCPLIQATHEPCESVVESIFNTISSHRPFWESLHLQGSFSKLESLDLSSSNKKHIPEIKYVGTLSYNKPTSYPTRCCYPVRDASLSETLEKEILKLITETDLTIPTHHTCIVFDARMTQHCNRKEKWHPEKAERVIEIYEKLKNSGLLEKCLLLQSREASEKELSLVHNASYINEIKATGTMTNRDIAKLQAEYQSVYLCQATYESAVLACGSLLQAVDAVLTRKCQNGFAVIRPPGHHAEIDEACGFCIFNSVAIAAKYALCKYNMKRILILDWDIHHGNGTQHIFFGDDSVLYISIHRYDHGSFFPSSPEANFEAVGEGPGLGFNINIPWSEGSMSDGDYLAALFHIILPVAYEYCPDLVIVSAGFDAAQDDPLGGCDVSPQCFGHMTHLLSALANGKLILALEGGYNISSSSEAVFHCIKALLGEPCNHLPAGLKPSQSAIATIQNVVEIHKKHWKCLQFNVDLPSVEANHLQTDDQETSLKNVIEQVYNIDNQKLSSPVSIPGREPEKELSDLKLEEAVASIREEILVCEGAEASWHDEGEVLFCVTPLEYCPHLELLQSLPVEGLDPNALCQTCRDPKENWVCLHCYQVYCGRFINQHMLQHGMNMQHYLTLSFSDLSVWCYGCDSYVHNAVLLPVKQHAHLKKFGVPM